MKNIFYLILSGFIFYACSSQKQVVDSSASTGNWEPLDKALLWQIKKKGHQPSFIYGTIHLINAEDFFFPEHTESSLAKTSKIVYEINMDDMNDMNAAMGLMTKAFMKDGVKLSDLLGEEDYSVVAEHFENMGLPMVFLDKIKPLFLTVLAGDDMDPMALSDGSILSYEMELDKLATDQGLSKGGLETIEYQLGIFDQIPYQDQAQMLLESIKMTEENDASALDAYGTIYKSQDLKKMHDMTLEEESGMEDFAEILLYDRNRNWIPIMEELTMKESVFFAVGAGHLGGTKGVLALLKDRGFTVEPVL